MQDLTVELAHGYPLCQKDGFSNDLAHNVILHQKLEEHLKK